MVRNRISDDARQVVFNVLLYFEQEAYRFKKQEHGYFQRVHERVTKACCVSRKFINTILKEEKFYQNYTAQSIGKGRRRYYVGQEFEPSALAAPRPTVIRTGPPPAPAPLLSSPDLPPAMLFYSKIEPPPLVPIMKRSNSPQNHNSNNLDTLLPPIIKNLDSLLPPIINNLDSLLPSIVEKLDSPLPPIVENLGTLPPLIPIVKVPQSSPGLQLLATSPDTSPYRYTPELFIDEDREINYSDNENIGPMPYDPLNYGYGGKMVREFDDDGEIG